MKEDLKIASTERIEREIELLQARLRSQKNGRADAIKDEEKYDGGEVSG
jgi:hypothetical protein